MHWGTFKQDNYSIVGGDVGGRVGEVRAGTTSPMPDHKGFKLQELPDPPTPFLSEFSERRINFFFLKIHSEMEWVDLSLAVPVVKN